MAIQIDLRVPPCAPVPEVGKFAALCETAGFDAVGILDSQMLERDVFVSMAAAAQATSDIRIASAVLNPVTRHLSVLASAMKTVAELAPGRAEFWIGRGFSSVQTVRIPPATVRQMRDGVLTLKSLLSGQNMEFGGATSRMRHGDAQVPRIVIAAHGPRTIEVAGEVADGVLLQVGLHPGSGRLQSQNAWPARRAIVCSGLNAQLLARNGMDIVAGNHPSKRKAFKLTFTRVANTSPNPGRRSV